MGGGACGLPRDPRAATATATSMQAELLPGLTGATPCPVSIRWRRPEPFPRGWKAAKRESPGDKWTRDRRGGGSTHAGPGFLLPPAQGELRWILDPPREY